MIFSIRILQWFQQHGRKHLPWQQDKTPYRVWVSEIMLQQTQVATVIPYYQRFMERFPDIFSLASAQQDEVLQLWTGLGYYARGRNLHKCAQVIVEQYQGHFPTNVEDLETLPGIGRSTAGAIVSLALNQPAPILDGNVKRVIARYRGIPGWPGQKKVADQLWKIAEELSPSLNASDYTQAMMDLGSTICTRTKPLCEQCPVHSKCHAFIEASQSLYPGKKPKKTLPVKTTQFLIVQNSRGSILLEKRPPTGIWGGLWSFPERAIEDDSLAYCMDHIGSINHSQSLSSFRHTFSHYQLEIHPLYIQINRPKSKIAADDKLRWCSEHEWKQLGLAAPVKKLLNKVDTLAPAL